MLWDGNGMHRIVIPNSYNSATAWKLKLNDLFAFLCSSARYFNNCCQTLSFHFLSGPKTRKSLENFLFNFLMWFWSPSQAFKVGNDLRIFRKNVNCNNGSLPGQRALQSSQKVGTGNQLNWIAHFLSSNVS